MKTWPKFPQRITIGDKYRPAMEITNEAEAHAYFECCVEHCMSHGSSREKAEEIERANLGYFAGYYDDETRARVERLFLCKHPVFGAIAENGPPNAKEAFNAGTRAPRESRRRGEDERPSKQRR